MSKTLSIPELSLVVLVGASGSGKSTFARHHFLDTEIVSSDFCRGIVSDDENDQSATSDAFDLLHYIAGKRLANGRLTVVDATNVDRESRSALVALARSYHCLPVAIVLNVQPKICQERNSERDDRNFGSHVIRRQSDALRRSLRGLKKEGFRHVFILDSPEEIASVAIERTKLWNNRKDDAGPFDIIGDVHGCFDELHALLTELGYTVHNGEKGWFAIPPAGRKAVFVGDLVDRGPGIWQTLELVMNMVESGCALCVPGNHDVKLVRQLDGRKVQIRHGLQQSIDQLADRPEAFCKRVREFLDGLVSHYVFDEGRLVVAHAGLKTEMQGRGSGRVRDFCLYGETTGETDEFGLPVRFDWAREYRGSAMVVYGHTPVPDPQWLNRTINIDTGCVFGGRLTALRYPENELVSIPARKVYAEPVRPLPAPSAEIRADDLLDVQDVMGKRIIETELRNTVTIREGQGAAALEVMSRFALHPRWLIYLPPTVSPSETSARDGLLEHPGEAFAYYAKAGVAEVICEEKHMGSRAVVIVCQDERTARTRFGAEPHRIGVCYTRTGRPFFDDIELEHSFLCTVQKTVGEAGLWERLNTSWVCLDCELMPWSAKAQALIQGQYAPVAAAARTSLARAEDALQQAAARLASVSGDDDANLKQLAAQVAERRELTSRFASAYRQYCWPVDGLQDLRLAPFHILATEGAVHSDKNHSWHMEWAQRLVDAQPEGSASLIQTTKHRVVRIGNADEVEAAVSWWEELTRTGGEGMVVKPLCFTSTNRRGLVQPAIKCRGREYLRIIYGPEYTRPDNLKRLRRRGLSRKRSLALREYALGIEALRRFVKGEPLYRYHECVFGILALESESVDPRL